MKKIAAIVMAIILGLTTVGQPVMATTAAGAVDAVILQECAQRETNEGGGIICILEKVINILSLGAGLFGVLGIAIVGIQYLTAGGNEEQTRKAKRRMFEIIIGLVVYFVLFGLLHWLMPHMTYTTDGDTGTPTQQSTTEQTT